MNLRDILFLISTYTLLVRQTSPQQLPSYINEGTCVSYTQKFPAGACAKYLSNSTVLVDRRDNPYTLDAKLKVLFRVMFPNFLRLMLEEHDVDVVKQHVFSSSMTFFCGKSGGNIPELAKLLTMLLDEWPAHTKLHDTIPFVEWYICHAAYPHCVHRYGATTHVSFPCASELRKLREIPLFAKLIDVLPVIMKFCWTSDEHNWVTQNTKTIHLKEPDIRFIENCQKHEEVDTQTTDQCYTNNGVNYNGTRNISYYGKSCIAWRYVVPGHVNSYNDLKDNHCRNPQGYGTQPWCYTDMVKREVSDCEIPQCENDGVGMLVGETSLALVVVAAIVVISVFSVVIRRGKGEAGMYQRYLNFDPSYR